MCCSRASSSTEHANFRPVRLQRFRQLRGHTASRPAPLAERHGWPRSRTLSRSTMTTCAKWSRHRLRTRARSAPWPSCRSNSTATSTSSSDIRWRSTPAGESWRSWSGPTVRPSTASPRPSESCAAVWDARAWGATFRISQRRQPWPPTCSTNVTCRSCAALWTSCRQRSRVLANLAQAMPVWDWHDRDTELRRRIRKWRSTP